MARHVGAYGAQDAGTSNATLPIIPAVPWHTARHLQRHPRGWKRRRPRHAPLSAATAR